MKNPLKLAVQAAVCLLLGLYSAKPAFASPQMLNINLRNSQTETHPLSDIRRITFSQREMIIDKRDSSTNTYLLSEIMNYTFSDPAPSSVGLLLDERMAMYPNPATDMTQLHIHSEAAEDLKIQLLDISGKLVSELYQGKHKGYSVYTLPLNASPGSYLCLLFLGQETMRLPLIIQ